MTTIVVETRISAPIEVCFDLARDVEAHIKTSLSTGERAVGSRTSGLLDLGDIVTFEAVHFGIRQRLTARITECCPPHFGNTHRFYPEANPMKLFLRGVQFAARQDSEFHTEKGRYTVEKTHLAIYLNDHLAGATGALELLTHLQEAHAGTPLADFLTQLYADIEADHQELRHLINRLGMTESIPRKLTAWLGEKAAELKLQLDDNASGSFRLFEGLEALVVGIEGKRALWQALATASEVVPELKGVDYVGLAQRAQQQHDRVDEQRLNAAKEALVATVS
jgi:hypothetical protein